MNTTARVISSKKDEFKTKFEAFKRNVKEKFWKTVYWINDNKEFIVIVVPAGVAVLNGTCKVIKSISRNIALKQEQRMKDMFIYDRSLGRYIELKRALTNADMKVILERKENGEKLSNILMDMNLVK